MKVHAKFWQKLSTAILWGSLSGLLLLFPAMVYLLQPTADIEQREIRDQVQQQKSILSQLRAETALLTTGYRSDPREEILTQLDLLFASVHSVDLELAQIKQSPEAVQRSWERYANSLFELQEIILDVSSASALYGFAVTQLEAVFAEAERELAVSDLPESMKRRYNLMLAKVMLQTLRHAALPSDVSALALEEHLTRIRVDSLTLPSAEAQSAFSKVVQYIDGLLESTDRIRQNAGRLMTMSSYEHLSSFQDGFDIWLDKAQRQQQQSRWTLLIAVILLISTVAVALIRLKITQERLLKTNTALSAYKTALDEHAIVSITDPKGLITYTNQKFVEVSGYLPDELLGKTHKMVNSGVHPKGYFKSLWQQVNLARVWHGEVCNRRKDGSLYWVNATVVPIMDSHQQLESIISVRTDISELKQIERALTAEKERAEVANKAKSDFLANMSHEIRTPMNAVIGMSHLARQASKDDQVVNYIDKIQHSAQNLLSIINDILDFSKIEAGRLEVESIPFRLDNVLNHLADLASVRADEKNLPLEFDIDDRIPNGLQGDPLRLGQVLLNLLNNAIKFTEQGRITISVQLLEQYDQAVQLRFAITDTGIGLTQEQVGRLFKSFSQADTSTTRQYGGTGLGLAISKQLVELMQGEIGVHSTPGEGSEFFFTSTLVQHQVDDDVEKIELSNIRVLMIDDDAACLQMVRDQLQALNISVHVENDAPSGLNRLVNASSMGEAPYNVLLVDWQMPIMDGLDVAKAVRHNSSLPWQPAIIMLTAHGGEDLQRRINHNLIDSVLLKPVTGSHLLDTIQETLVKRAKEYKGSSIRTLFREGDEINALLGANVLIAEDNLINQEVITGLLEPYGLNLHLVSNGREAVNALQEHEFDLVFMDIQMPEVDGLKATEQILQMRLPKTPPIVAMTAHAQSDDIRHCLEAGMSDHIAKPINPEILKGKLIRWIEPRVISGYAPDTLETAEEPVFPCAPYGVNLSSALHSMGGSSSLLMKLMYQFCNDYRDGLLPATEMMAEGDWDSLHRWLHTLRGAASTLGMQQIADYAAGVEKLHFDHILPGPGDLALLGTELKQVIQSIDDCMAAQSVGQATAADQAFAARMQPMSGVMNQERLDALLPGILAMLQEGDSEVLDLLPELLEAVQADAARLDLAIQVMEQAQDYEFDQAIETLQKLM